MAHISTNNEDEIFTLSKCYNALPIQALALLIHFNTISLFLVLYTSSSTVNVR